MNKSLKIILILGLLIGNCNLVLAEKLPSKYINGLNSTDNPVWYKYLYDYKEQLYKAFDARKFRKKEWGHIFIYTINRDGSITDMIKYDTLDESDKYIRQVILDTPPPPFPKEIEEYKVRADVSLWSVNDDEYKINYYTDDKKVVLIIGKDRRHKK